MAGIWYEAGRKRNRSKPYLTPAGFLSTDSSEETEIEVSASTSLIEAPPASYAEKVRQSPGSEEKSMASETDDQDPLDPAETGQSTKVTTRLTKMFFGKLNRKQQRGSRSIFAKRDKEEGKKTTKKRKNESKASNKTKKRARHERSDRRSQPGPSDTGTSTGYDEIVSGPLPNLYEIQTAEGEVDPASTTVVLDASELDPSFRCPTISEQNAAHPSERLIQSTSHPRPMSIQAAPTRYDSDGNQLPPIDFQPVKEGFGDLLLVSEIYQYLSVGQLELYRIRGPAGLEFAINRLYATYYSLIGFTTVFLPCSSKSITMIAKTVYRVLVAAQTGPEQHTETISIVADQLSAVLENLIDVARAYCIGNPVQPDNDRSVKSLIDSLTKLVEDVEASALFTALTGDLAKLPSTFNVTEHVVTCIRFSMEKIDQLANLIASKPASGKFSGYRAQIIQELPRPSQQYLQNLRVVKDYPSFEVQSSGFSDHKFGAYLENYLNTLPGINKESGVQFQICAPTSLSRFPVPPLPQISALGDHIKIQRTARLRELERQAKATHIQEQENEDKDKRGSSSEDRPSKDTITLPERVQVDSQPTNQSTEAPELFIVDLRSGDPKTYQLSPISTDEFKRRFAEAEQRKSTSNTTGQTEPEHFMPELMEIAFDSNQDPTQQDYTNPDSFTHTEHIEITASNRVLSSLGAINPVETRSKTKSRSKTSTAMDPNPSSERISNPETLYQETFGNSSDEEAVPNEARDTSSQLSGLSIESLAELEYSTNAGLISAGQLFQPHSRDEKSRLRAWAIPTRATTEIPFAIDFKRQFPSPKLASLGNRIDFELVQSRKQPGKSQENWEIGQSTFREYTQDLIRSGESTDDFNMQQELKELENMSQRLGEDQVSDKVGKILSRLINRPAFCSDSEPILSLRILQPGLFFLHSTFEDDKAIDGISRGTYVFGNLIGPLAFLAVRQIARDLITSPKTALQTEVINAILLRHEMS